jgi:hypothetical protein
MEKGMGAVPTKVDSNGPSVSQVSVAEVGREHLSDALPPHESYEGHDRYDPGATWTEQEERRLVRKTDFYLLSWICVMVITTPGYLYGVARLINCSSSACNLIVEICPTLWPTISSKICILPAMTTTM